MKLPALRLMPGLVLCAICVASTMSASAATNMWQRQRVGSMAWLHSVFFINHNCGWAVGSRGTLLSTIDGGKTWNKQPQPTEDTIRDIYFATEEIGLLVCERNIYDLRTEDDPRAYLMKTVDGGEHWKRLNLRGVDVDGRLMRAVFSDSGRGWAFGEGGAVYTTSDSGINWLRIQAPTKYLLLGGTFIDDNRGWLVGAGTTILQTTDGGETWQHTRVSSTANVRFNSTSFVDGRLGWAVGSGGSIYRTVNGGRSWQQQRSGTYADLLDVKFLDALEGWAVGAEGTILHTTNGGLTWRSEPSGTPHALERIFFTDRSHGWVVGFGGTIVSYSLGQAPRLR